MGEAMAASGASDDGDTLTRKRFRKEVGMKCDDVDHSEGEAEEEAMGASGATRKSASESKGLRRRGA